MPQRIVKSISIPLDEERLIEEAVERIFREADYPMVNHSMLFRIAIRALLRVPKDTLCDIVWSVPELKTGPRSR